MSSQHKDGHRFPCGCVKGYYWCSKHDIYNRQDPEDPPPHRVSMHTTKKTTSNRVMVTIQRLQGNALNKYIYAFNCKNIHRPFNGIHEAYEKNSSRRLVTLEKAVEPGGNKILSYVDVIFSEIDEVFRVLNLFETWFPSTFTGTSIAIQCDDIVVTFLDSVQSDSVSEMKRLCNEMEAFLIQHQDEIRALNYP